MVLVKDIPIKIPREEVLRLLKHVKEATVIDPKTSDLINKLIEEGKTLCEGKAIYTDYLIKSIGERSVILEGSSFDLLGKSTAHRLWNAKKVTLFVVTIGSNLEKKIKEYSKTGSISSAAILDAVGSAAVESYVNHVNEIIDNKAKEAGYKTTKRFSPGYGDWELKEQKGLFQLLNASQIGVSLTGANLMQPEKSISGVVGWIK